MEERSLATGSTAAPPETVAAVLVPSPRRLKVRFTLVYGALGLILVGSLAALVVFCLRPGLGSSTTWSSWRPPAGHPIVVAKEIADYVGPKYKFANGGQLL